MELSEKKYAITAKKEAALNGAASFVNYHSFYYLLALIAACAAAKRAIGTRNGEQLT